MNNLLSIPFKKTLAIPIRQAVKEYIHNAHPDTHPDAFKEDISRWELLRKGGIGGVAHPDRIQSMTQCVANFPGILSVTNTINRYHAQLVFISTKLPNDVSQYSVLRTR